MQKKSQLFDFQIRVNPTLFSVFFLVAVNTFSSNAQKMRQFLGPSKKKLYLKIDSLEKLIDDRDQIFNEKMIRIEKKIQEQDLVIKRLTKENKLLSIKFDSIRSIFTNDQIPPEKDTLISDFWLEKFCPDSSQLSKIEILKDCECFKNNTVGTSVSSHGFQVLLKGIEMVADTKKIVKGSCWNYINTVYNNAGFTSSYRQTVYKAKKGSKIKNIDLLNSGDWIYHINHSFRNVEHSAIFICWKDYNKKIGITLSHVGQNKARTGQFGAYDLKSVYNIKRPLKNE